MGLCGYPVTPLIAMRVMVRRAKKMKRRAFQLSPLMGLSADSLSTSGAIPMGSMSFSNVLTSEVVVFCCTTSAGVLPVMR